MECPDSRIIIYLVAFCRPVLDLSILIISEYARYVRAIEPAGSIVPVSLLIATVMLFPCASAAGSAVTQPDKPPVQSSVSVSVSIAAVILFFM